MDINSAIGMMQMCKIHKYCLGRECIFIKEFQSLEASCRVYSWEIACCISVLLIELVLQFCFVCCNQIILTKIGP